MNNSMTKGKSPFYPGQPVPVDLFVGRREQIERIMTRGVGQVSAGKPVAVFVQGEYGIGKSSVAGFLQWLAEREHGLLGIYATLGGAETIDDLGATILEATIRSGVWDPKRSEQIRNWLAKYIGQQTLLGSPTIRFDALRQDGPDIAQGLLPFLATTLEKVRNSGIKGLFLVLDEINGITANPKFAHFIKGLVDTNAMARSPIPLLLMLCGVAERRSELIRSHQPVERIFDVVDIERLSDAEMKEFWLFSRKCTGPGPGTP